MCASNSIAAAGVAAALRFEELRHELQFRRMVHRETALHAWRPAVQRSSTSAKDVWLDSQLMNRLMVEQVRFEPLPRPRPPFHPLRDQSRPRLTSGSCLC